MINEQWLQIDNSNIDHIDDSCIEQNPFYKELSWKYPQIWDFDSWHDIMNRFIELNENIFKNELLNEFNIEKIDVHDIMKRRSQLIDASVICSMEFCIICFNESNWTNYKLSDLWVIIWTGWTWSTCVCPNSDIDMIIVMDQDIDKKIPKEHLQWIINIWATNIGQKNEEFNLRTISEINKQSIDIWYEFSLIYLELQQLNEDGLWFDVIINKINEIYSKNNMLIDSGHISIENILESYISFMQSLWIILSIPDNEKSQIISRNKRSNIKEILNEIFDFIVEETMKYNCEEFKPRFYDFIKFYSKTKKSESDKAIKQQYHDNFYHFYENFLSITHKIDTKYTKTFEERKKLLIDKLKDQIKIFDSQINEHLSMRFMWWDPNLFLEYKKKWIDLYKNKHEKMRSIVYSLYSFDLSYPWINCNIKKDFLRKIQNRIWLEQIEWANIHPWPIDNLIILLKNKGFITQTIAEQLKKWLKHVWYLRQLLWYAWISTQDKNTKDNQFTQTFLNRFEDIFNKNKESSSLITAKDYLSTIIKEIYWLAFYPIFILKEYSVNSNPYILSFDKMISHDFSLKDDKIHYTWIEINWINEAINFLNNVMYYIWIYWVYPNLETFIKINNSVNLIFPEFKWWNNTDTTIELSAYISRNQEQILETLSEIKSNKERLIWEFFSKWIYRENFDMILFYLARLWILNNIFPEFNKTIWYIQSNEYSFDLSNEILISFYYLKSKVLKNDLLIPILNWISKTSRKQKILIIILLIKKLYVTELKWTIASNSDDLYNIIVKTLRRFDPDLDDQLTSWRYFDKYDIEDIFFIIKNYHIIFNEQWINISMFDPQNNMYVQRLNYHLTKWWNFKHLEDILLIVALTSEISKRPQSFWITNSIQGYNGNGNGNSSSNGKSNNGNGNQWNKIINNIAMLHTQFEYLDFIKNALENPKHKEQFWRKVKDKLFIHLRNNFKIDPSSEHIDKFISNYTNDYYFSYKLFFDAVNSLKSKNLDTWFRNSLDRFNIIIENIDYEKLSNEFVVMNEPLDKKSTYSIIWQHDIKDVETTYENRSIIIRMNNRSDTMMRLGIFLAKKWFSIETVAIMPLQWSNNLCNIEIKRCNWTQFPIKEIVESLDLFVNNEYTDNPNKSAITILSTSINKFVHLTDKPKFKKYKEGENWNWDNVIEIEWNKDIEYIYARIMYVFAKHNLIVTSTITTTKEDWSWFANKFRLTWWIITDDIINEISNILSNENIKPDDLVLE